MINSLKSAYELFYKRKIDYSNYKLSNEIQNMCFILDYFAHYSFISDKYNWELTDDLSIISSNLQKKINQFIMENAIDDNKLSYLEYDRILKIRNDLFNEIEEDYLNLLVRYLYNKKMHLVGNIEMACLNNCSIKDIKRLNIIKEKIK